MRASVPASGLCARIKRAGTEACTLRFTLLLVPALNLLLQFPRLLIDIAEDRGFDDYLALIEELESLLARRVDVVIDRSLSPHFRPYIEAEAQPL